MTHILKGITWEHARGLRQRRGRGAEAYREVAPDVEVRWEQRSLQAFADQPLEWLVEEYDLLVIDHPHIPLAAEHGLFARLDGVGHDERAGDRSPRSRSGASHETYAHAGGQWGLATDAAAQVAAYRPDLLPEPPRDWPGVLALAEQGRVLWPYKPVDAFSSLVTVASGNGEEPMRTPGVFLSADALAEAMETLRRLAPLVPRREPHWNPIQTADALSAARSLRLRPPDVRLHELQPRRLPGPPAQVHRHPLVPRRGSRGRSSGAPASPCRPRRSIRSRRSPTRSGSTPPQVQEGVYYDAGGQPGNAVAWESDRTNADSLDFFRGTRATLEGAYVRPRFVHYIELQNALSELVNAGARRRTRPTMRCARGSTRASRNGWWTNDDGRSLVRGHRGRASAARPSAGRSPRRTSCCTPGRPATSSRTTWTRSGWRPSRRAAHRARHADPRRSRWE